MMSDKRQWNEYEQRRELNAAGWQVEKSDIIAFNGGSETNRHFVTKAQAGWFLSQRGYRVDSEVPNKTNTAVADLVAYGMGEPAFVVEVETGLTEEMREEKLDQFYYNTPFCECYLLECNDMPEDRMEQLEWLESELGGTL